MKLKLLHKTVLNTICFDMKTKAVDRRIVTLDLQRKYRKDRVRNGLLCLS